MATIADYQRAYQEAQKNYDYEGMAAANRAANALRAQMGQAAVDASQAVKSTIAARATASGAGPNVVVDDAYVRAVMGGNTNQYYNDLGVGSGGGGGGVAQPTSAPAPAQQTAADTRLSEAELYAIQERKRLAALDASRRNALASLGAERGQVNPAYNMALSNVAGQSALGARNLAELLAQRGLSNSGAAVQGELVRQGTLQDNMTSLEAERANWLSDIGRRETAAQSAYDEGALQAALTRDESELEARLRAMEQARQESISTVGQYYNDYAAEINAIEAEIARGDNSRAYLLPYLRIARQEKLDSMPVVGSSTPVASGARSATSTASSTSSTTAKPTLTAAQARDAYNKGIYSDAVLEAYSYHYGIPLMSLGNVGEVEQLLKQRTIPSSQVALIEQYNVSGKISDAQAMALLQKYGLVR